ncbi:hypothetical protein J5751_03375 [bacterium]|nr:hypothetical protein [bacterium]
MIGKIHKIKPKNILFEKVSGNKTKTTKIKLTYAKSHIKVGTGHLTPFKSAPGLSNTFHFLKQYRPIKNTNAIIKNERIYVIVILSIAKDIKSIYT